MTTEWVEIRSQSILELVHDLSVAFADEAKDMGCAFWPYSLRASTSEVVRNFLENFFKNGLKYRADLERPGKLQFKIVETPSEAISPLTILAMAFEIRIWLEPRYQVDGRKGFYHFRFYLKALKEYSAGARNVEGKIPTYLSLVVSNSFNNSAKRKRERQSEQIRAASESVWRELRKDGLRHLIQGGLPSLGKKR